MKLNTLVLAASLSFASASALASVSEALEFDQLVHQADTVVVVEKKSSKQIRDNGVMLTQTTFKVLQAGFGFDESEIVVETLGGDLSHMKYPVSQAGANNILFITNQPMLLMLNEGEDGVYQITSQQQGMFPITKNQVLLPQSQGGSASVDDAIELVRDIQATEQ